MRLAQRHHPVAQVVGNGLDLGVLAARHHDQTADDREDILDPMAQLMADQLALFHRLFLVVDIGTCPKPARYHSALVAHRHAAAQHPTIAAVMVPNPIFDFVQLPTCHRLLPSVPGAVLIFWMEHPGPAFAVGSPVGYSSIFVPAGVVIIDAPIGQGRPHHLRHGIGQRCEALLAVVALVARRAGFGLHCNDRAIGLEQHHDRLGKGLEAVPLEVAEVEMRHCVDHAQ